MTQIVQKEMAFLNQRRQVNLEHTPFGRGRRPHAGALRSSAGRTLDQSLAGNQAAHRFAQSCPLRLPSPSTCPFGGVCHKCPAPKVQAKLKIGRPDDEYEREADRVADRVMRMPEPYALTPACASKHGQAIHIQRACVSGEEELNRQYIKDQGANNEKSTLTKGIDARNPHIASSLAFRIDGFRGRGRPLPESARIFFESRFDQDLGNVRIHDNSEAARIAQVLHAKAFTIGHNIAFDAGQYAPENFSGKSLLAHELTHVIQQTENKHIREKSDSSLITAKNSKDQIHRRISVHPLASASDRTTIENDMHQLESDSNTGRSLINRIRDWWVDTVEIDPVSGSCASQGPIRNTVLVHYNCSRCPITPMDSTWENSSIPNYVYLAHELIHALHRAEGTHAGPTDLEEWGTVGLGRHAAREYTENRVRCEIGAAPRTFYRLSDVSRYHLQGYGDPHCNGQAFVHPRQPG